MCKPLKLFVEWCWRGNWWGIDCRRFPFQLRGYLHRILLRYPDGMWVAIDDEGWSVLLNLSSFWRTVHRYNNQEIHIFYDAIYCTTPKTDYVRVKVCNWVCFTVPAVFAHQLLQQYWYISIGRSWFVRSWLILFQSIKMIIADISQSLWSMIILNWISKISWGGPFFIFYFC